MPLKIFNKSEKISCFKIEPVPTIKMVMLILQIFNTQLCVYLTVSTSYKFEISLLDVVRATGTNRRFSMIGQASTFDHMEPTW